MGTITSGVGLVSGLDIEGIVQQLMEIESRPKDQLNTRIEDLTAKQQAIMEVQARVMAVQLSAANFNKQSVFEQKSALISNEDILSVSAGRYAATGSYSFVVNRLASNDHLVSQGYLNADSSVGSGSISIEMGQGQLNRATSLDFINGHQGFTRGQIAITDRAGNTAQIDLRNALTVEDILDEINRNSTVHVEADVEGDTIVLRDVSGGSSNNLIVEDVDGGSAAASLGLAQSVAGETISGADLLWITDNTRLIDLNDGNGVRNLNSGLDDLTFTLRSGHSFGVDFKDKLHETIGDESASTRLSALNHGHGVRGGVFRITDRNNRRIDIDLADLGSEATLGQLKKHIEDTAAANNMDITVMFGSQDHLSIRDNSEPLGGEENGERRSNFIIEDLSGGSAAADLGIVRDTKGGTITGEKVWFMETVGDAINAVNNHWLNDGTLMLSLEGQGEGITVTDVSALSGELKIEAANDSMVGADLGLLTDPAGFSGAQFTTRRLISGLNTVMLASLNGGSAGTNRIGEGGKISLTDGSGNPAVEVDLNNAFTVQDVINEINNAGTNIQASLNAVGNGILITDTTGTGSFTISDVEGQLATQLNIAVENGTNSVDSGNLQLQYISEATLLDDMRQGEGIRRGRFEIVDGNGRRTTIDLQNDSIKTLGDVIDLIDSRGLAVRASINETGDGLIITDDGTSNGAPITVADVGGYSARDLRIHGVATADENYLDGSYEFRLDVGGGDSLADIVDQINEAKIGINASLINDGSNSNPYRLSLTSDIGGAAGRLHLDAGATSLNTQKLTTGQDAIVYFGGGENQNPLLISSNSNTLENAIKGTTIDLLKAGDEAVEVTIDQDLESIKSSMESFVETYNEAADLIAEYTRFDPDTLEKGLLFADSTVSNMERTLQSLVQRFIPTGGSFTRLSDVGLSFSRLGTENGTNAAGDEVSYAVAGTPHLSFDATLFSAVYSADPDGVVDLFTMEELGVGDYIADTLDRLAGNSESTLKNHIQSMQNRQKLYQDRIEHLSDLLASKEARLYQQFYAMEQSLATMQTQQSALASLSQLTASVKASSSSQ